MTPVAQSKTEPVHSALSLTDIVLPKHGQSATESALDALHTGLQSILAQWALGTSSFGWLRHVGAQHVKLRVRDGSDEDDRALIFSIVPLPGDRVTQEFRVSTEGRGLLGKIEAPDRRILAGLRGPREMWSWADLKHFIEQQPTLTRFLNGELRA